MSIGVTSVNGHCVAELALPTFRKNVASSSSRIEGLARDRWRYIGSTCPVGEGQNRMASQLEEVWAPSSLKMEALLS
jgi:hypothetical protein